MSRCLRSQRRRVFPLVEVADEEDLLGVGYPFAVSDAAGLQDIAGQRFAFLFNVLNILIFQSYFLNLPYTSLLPKYVHYTVLCP